MARRTLSAVEAGTLRLEVGQGGAGTGAGRWAWSSGIKTCCAAEVPLVAQDKQRGVSGPGTWRLATATD